ncbi:MAG: glycosyltransferase family 4 protein [Planctomycetes bacterium]|nr:glycosyltransferase family 4 protein [Planctomycetota bacterium]
MRIAMLCSGHPVDDARVAHKQARSLALAGHDVAVFGRRAAGGEEIPPVQLRPLAPRGGGTLRRMGMLPKLYRAAVAWRADVVVCHEPQSAIVGVLLKHFRGMKMIFDSHECFHETFSWRIGGLAGRLIRAASIVFARLLIPRCDWVTVVSGPNQRFLGKMRRDGRVDILHNSPIVELFPPCSQDVDGPVTAVHEGNLSRGRGMVQMLEALAIAREECDLKLLIIGQIVPADRALYERTVERLGLAEAVEFAGWTPWRKLGRVESRAQIGLACHQYSPNNFMSLGNKVYNYMCCGQPVIAPAGSATADIVRRYDCGLPADSSDPRQIARAMVRLAGDAELRKRLGANGRRAIEQELGWHKMEETMARIYAQLERELPGPPSHGGPS